MKTLLLTFLVLALPAHARKGGNSVDNGGEYLAVKFTTIGYEVLSALKKLKPEEAILNLQELKRMEGALVSTRVDAVNGPIYDNAGKTVDARFVNDSSKPTIEFDQQKWEGFLENSADMYRLVFHEYLRVMRVNDDNYRVSARLESGLVNEILLGRVQLEPGNVAKQSLFEQLGDYFRQGKATTPKDFSIKRKGLCFYKDDDQRELQMLPYQEDNGPLLQPTEGIVIEIAGGGGTIHYPFSNMNIENGSTHFIGDYEYFFRTKGKYLFAEVFDDKKIFKRCYFWAAK